MTGVIVLAAGESSRMGQPKQLLPFRGSTLLRHAVETALAAALGPVVVVLGAEAERCRAELEGLAVHVVINAGWKTGMSGSIRAGVEELDRIEVECEGVLIVLHDQPAISAARLGELVSGRQPGDLAVGSVYDDALGVPAFFARDLFGELGRLAGRAGARGLLEAHAAQVRRFSMPEARHDIDTPADYARLRGE